MSSVAVTTPADVELALQSPLLVPPPPPATLQPGATWRLRSSMARFSDVAGHAARRGEVEAAALALDAAQARRLAAERTADRLHGAPIDAMADVALVVPTEVLGVLLGIAAEPRQFLADVAAMVRVIGRGEPSTPATDEAVERLLAQADGSVAAVSLLYQNHDATAALIGTTLAARAADAPRRAAVVRTVRVATAELSIGATRIAPGDTVLVDLAASGFEFGCGPHACPGRAVAEAIAGGVVAAIDAAGYAVVTAQAEFDDDGRPTLLPLRPP